MDCPVEIHNPLAKRNRDHFGQSKDCTLTTPPLDFTMDFTATCQRAEAILQGRFLSTQSVNLSPTVTSTNPTSRPISGDPPSEQPLPSLDDSDSDDRDSLSKGPLHLQCTETPPLVQLLLDSLQYTASPDHIPAQLMEEDYKGKIKAWSESTSTSPTTNMHLGHLKAYWAEHTLPENSHKAKTLQQSRQQILDGHLALLNYTIRFSHPYQPWTHIVNTMLEKDPGSPKLHQLQVIHLYKADYNLILGVKWRQVLHHACSQGYINPGCYRSQPGKEAMDALILQEMEYEMS